MNEVLLLLVPSLWCRSAGLPLGLREEKKKADDVMEKDSSKAPSFISQGHGCQLGLASCSSRGTWG